MDCSSTLESEQGVATGTEQEAETSSKKEKEQKEKGSRTEKLMDLAISTSDVQKEKGITP